MPFLRSSLDTRTCPKAGLAMAICTTGLLYALLHAVLYHRLFTGNLLQGQFSALLVQFLETIKTVTAVSHNLAGS